MWEAQLKAEVMVLSWVKDLSEQIWNVTFHSLISFLLSNSFGNSRVEVLDGKKFAINLRKTTDVATDFSNRQVSAQS